MKLIHLPAIGGQLDEIVFFLVAFGIAINLILFVIHFCSDCLCCVENKYYYCPTYLWLDVRTCLQYYSRTLLEEGESQKLTLFPLFCLSLSLSLLFLSPLSLTSSPTDIRVWSCLYNKN